MIETGRTFSALFSDMEFYDSAKRAGTTKDFQRAILEVLDRHTAPHNSLLVQFAADKDSVAPLALCLIVS